MVIDHLCKYATLPHASWCSRHKLPEDLPMERVLKGCLWVQLGARHMVLEPATLFLTFQTLRVDNAALDCCFWASHLEKRFVWYHMLQHRTELVGRFTLSSQQCSVTGACDLHT